MVVRVNYEDAVRSARNFVTIDANEKSFANDAGYSFRRNKYKRASVSSASLNNSARKSDNMADKLAVEESMHKESARLIEYNDYHEREDGFGSNSNLAPVLSHRGKRMLRRSSNYEKPSLDDQEFSF